jgi:hypothetical protein
MNWPSQAFSHFALAVSIVGRIRRGRELAPGEFWLNIDGELRALKTAHRESYQPWLVNEKAVEAPAAAAALLKRVQV